MSVVPGAEPYSHDGGQTAVLLIHGFTGSPASLRPWGQQLAQRGFTVRLPLLPGHGTTWQEMQRTTWHDWYRTLDVELSSLVAGGHRVVLAGLSMGATLATRLAEERPADVRGLALVNPAFTADDPRLRFLPVLKHLMRSAAGISNDIALPGQDEVAYDRVPVKAMASQMELWKVTTRDLPKVTQPVLLLRSRQDNVVPARSSEILLRRISSHDVTEVVLERSHHVATLDHDADEIVERSITFAARVAGPIGAGA